MVPSGFDALQVADQADDLAVVGIELETRFGQEQSVVHAIQRQQEVDVAE